MWGSDIIAAMVRELDVPYLAINPGASFRGLHDSIVNHLGNVSPKLLLCLHEESAVSLAQGYAKVSEHLMGVVLHSNVGLMHATMAIFNAWCDRTPMLLLGATGPWDAAKRRPWIDWLHTSSDQGALVRDYTKWDNQPGSVTAACEALMRAVQIADTAPRGPTYINLDQTMQEEKIGPAPKLPDVKRFAAARPASPARALVDEAAALLLNATRPLILAGRVSRSEAGWAQRVELAERLQATVLTDIKTGAAFPTDHPLHAAPAGVFLSPQACKALREADVVLSLDWMDLAGALKQAYGRDPITAKVIQVSVDAHSHRGWSMDYQALPPIDAYLMCEPEPAVSELLGAVAKRTTHTPIATPYARKQREFTSDELTIHRLADAINRSTAGMDVCLGRVPLGWEGDFRAFTHPLDYIGLEGGAGVGAGPGVAIGAALALKDTPRLPISVMGDGDFLMGATAVWTAAHYRIPCLIFVANNASYFIDELHQERMANNRERPVENKWIGQRMGDPDIDIAMLARSQGAHALTIASVAELQGTVARAIELVQSGEVCVVDVRIVNEHSPA